MEIPCAVSPEVAEEIDRIAASTDRSRSQIARKMVSRGLAAYKRDGLLDEPLETVSVNGAPADIPTAQPILTEKIPHDLKEGLKLSPQNRKGGRK